MGAVAWAVVALVAVAFQEVEEGLEASAAAAAGMVVARTAG